jgi:hypothetical protein
MLRALFVSTNGELKSTYQTEYKLVKIKKVVDYTLIRSGIITMQIA